MSTHIVARIAVAAASVMGSLVAPVAAQSPPPLVPFTGTVASGVGTVTLTLNIYAEASGGDSLWTETQNVQVDAHGQFQALLGLTAASGLPAELFTDNETRWLGVRANGQPEGARTLLTSVPYALKAADANTLGGLPASAFLLADDAGALSDTAGASGVRSPQTDGDGGLGDTSGEGLVESSGELIADDLIVQGSICAGLDCVNGEAFGFDTLRLKENNLRIKFDDTSTTASFPNNDWQLTANDTTNGGANKFSIDDITGGRTPFTIRAGAPSNSIFVDSGGRLGLGTNIPVVNLHVVSGNTPTLRLEQNASSGFTPQIWDVAGNEANFFIRDVTGASTLPLRIFPGAPSSALAVENTGDIGLGTTSPEQDLHVRKTSGTTFVRVENTATANTGFQFKNGALSGAPWNAFTNNSGAFTIANAAVGGAAAELTIESTNGNVIIGNDLIVTGQCSEVDGPCAPDYVFEPDYDLPSLDELEAFVAEHKHLPNVPSAEEIHTGGLNMRGFNFSLLEKIEELVLYTLDQQETIEDLKVRLRALEEGKAR